MEPNSDAANEVTSAGGSAGAAGTEDRRALVLGPLGWVGVGLVLYGYRFRSTLAVLAGGAAIGAGLKLVGADKLPFSVRRD